MSIENTTEQAMSASPSPTQKKKSAKKHKHRDEKKRKRDNADETVPSKSKKRKRPSDENEKLKVPDSEQDSSDQSPFHTQTASLYLPLSPISQKKPLEGICAEHLSSLILNYYPPLCAIVLSYSNPRLSERPYGDDGDNVLLHCIDEYAVGWVWVTADFLLFKPERGGWLEGYINLQNEGHLGLVCWNLFNASIERKRLPKSWKWTGLESNAKTTGLNTEEEPEYGVGRWVDGDGNDVDGMIKFRVKDIETGHDRERGFLTVEGTMLDEDEERQLVEMEDSSQTGKEAIGRRLGGSRALGATNLGSPVVAGQDRTDGYGAISKHRRSY